LQVGIDELDRGEGIPEREAVRWLREQRRNVAESKE
jgi:hypothetical protein